MGEDAGLTPLKRLLIDRTQGNPFFLEETVRSLAESRALAGIPGDYRLAAALPTIHIPATVQAVLAARIDRLPDDDKRLLQLASVVGKDVSLAGASSDRRHGRGGAPSAAWPVSRRPSSCTRPDCSRIPSTRSGTP